MRRPLLWPVPVCCLSAHEHEPGLEATRRGKRDKVRVVEYGVEVPQTYCQVKTEKNVPVGLLRFAITSDHPNRECWDGAP